jgi:hypothetical protein
MPEKNTGKLDAGFSNGEKQGRKPNESEEKPRSITPSSTSNSPRKRLTELEDW